MPAVAEGSAADPCADGHKGAESTAALDHHFAHVVDQFSSAQPVSTERDFGSLAGLIT